MGRTLLVTAFGPFPTMPRNPSAALAAAVARSPRWRVLGIAVRCRVLTTAYSAIVDEFEPLLGERPDAVLMIGVAGRSRRVRVETRATSRRSVLFPDVSGETTGTPSPRRQPPARGTTLPSAKALRVLRTRLVPVRPSGDAGRYLCNAAYFHALSRVPGAVFIHIPKPPAPRPGRRVRSGQNASGRLAAALVDLGILLLAQSRRR